MKLLHISDLHLGKRLNEFNLLEDQEYILNQILDIAKAEEPDGILIAGDVYDKSIPSAEAVSLFDKFLTRLAGMEFDNNKKLKIFIISGNHDSAERVAFGADLIKNSGVYISPVYDGNISPVELQDEYGKVYVYMLPFIKPVHVREALRKIYKNQKTDEEIKQEIDDKIKNYTDAARAAVSRMGIDKTARNILIAHQYITGATRSDSEMISVGGLDNIDGNIFDDFDYVALGHLHRPQSVGRESVRYCGTPLKYSFSEKDQKKSVTVIELAAKGDILIKTADLIPKRDLRELRGFYQDLTLRENYKNINTDDYIRIILTDENEIPDAMIKLRGIYKNLMEIQYDNKRGKAKADLGGGANPERRSPMEIFKKFYKDQNNCELSPEQEKYASELMESIWASDHDE